MSICLKENLLLLISYQLACSVCPLVANTQVPLCLCTWVQFLLFVANVFNEVYRLQFALDISQKEVIVFSEMEYHRKANLSFFLPKYIDTLCNLNEVNIFILSQNVIFLWTKQHSCVFLDLFLNSKIKYNCTIFSILFLKNYRN